MASVTSLVPTSSRSSFSPTQFNLFSSCLPPLIQSSVTTKSHPPARRLALSAAAPQLSVPQRSLIIDNSVLVVGEVVSDEELWAATCLRVRCFNNFKDCYGIEDHKRYLAACEFEALKERISGKREDLRKVCCINASLPLTHVPSIYEDLYNNCKFSVAGGEERIVVGTLDLNQCLRLPNEIAGMKPVEGVGADLPRAYLSNVCVAQELQRNGLGYKLIVKGRSVAEDWGMSDLYVHVAIDNEAAKRLYLKSGFVRESDEPAWQARFLSRTRRTILWMGLSS